VASRKVRRFSVRSEDFGARLDDLLDALAMPIMIAERGLEAIVLRLACMRVSFISFISNDTKITFKK
jgi:hypothetical protein